MIEGSLEVKLPTIWTDGKAEVGRVREEKRRSEKIKEEKKIAVGKSRLISFFQWFVAPEGRKVGSLKRRVRSHVVRWQIKNCTLLWREAHLEAKTLKTPYLRTLWDVEKVHAVVARSTFPSRKCWKLLVSDHFWKLRCLKRTPLSREAHFQVKMYKNTSASDHFWKLRCSKSARHCGVKHISKSKCTKHISFGPLLEVEMSKKWTQLWREAPFQVKMVETQHVRTTFGSWEVQKVHAVVERSTFPSKHVQNTSASDHVVARSMFPSQNGKSTTCSSHFWKLRCRKSARRCGAKHVWKSKV